MSALKDWLLAGSPAHYLMLLGLAYSGLEYALPRIKSVKAQSFWEAVFNVAGKVFPQLKGLGTPE